MSKPAQAGRQVCLEAYCVSPWKYAQAGGLAGLACSPVVSLIHYIGNCVMVLSIRFFDGFVFWVST